VPDNAGWALAVLVVFQDLFIGAFFSDLGDGNHLFLCLSLMLRFGNLIAGCGDGILLCGTEGMAGEQGLRGRPKLSTCGVSRGSK
jgi:hypothetical protein